MFNGGKSAKFCTKSIKPVRIYKSSHGLYTFLVYRVRYMFPDLGLSVPDFKEFSAGRQDLCNLICCVYRERAAFALV
jgi:hypothetical protein